MKQISPKKILIFLLTLIVIGFTSSMHQRSGVSPTPEDGGESELALTPPPALLTPIPPEGILYEFSLYYNQRNSTAIYSMFSDNVKANHTLEDVKEQIEIAENHGIEIVKQEILNETVRDGLSISKASLMLLVDRRATNISIDFPVIYMRYELRENGLQAIGYEGLIDEWIFNELHFGLNKSNMRRSFVI